MTVIGRLRVVLRGLNENRGRLALVSITLSLGTVLLVLTLSLYRGVEDRLSALMEVFFHPNEGGITYGRLAGESDRPPVVPPPLRLHDLQLLQNKLGGEAMFAGEIQETVTISHAGHHLMSLVTAAEPLFLRIKNWRIISGSALNYEDERSLNRVCILTTDTARKLFGDKPCIDQSLTIDGVPFLVKGLRSANESAAQLSPAAAQQVLIPLSTGMERLWNEGGPTVIQFRARKGVPIQRVVDDMAVLLRKQHHVVPPQQDDFEIFTGEKMTEHYWASKRSMLLAGFALSLLTFLAGGAVAVIVIATSLAQRKKEFALKRALGASLNDVSWEVLLEPVLVSAGAFIEGSVISLVALAVWRHTAPAMAIKLYPLKTSAIAFAFPAALEVVVGFSCGALTRARLATLEFSHALRT